MASNDLGHEVLHLPREDTDALPEGRSDRLSGRHDMQPEPPPSERALRGRRYAGYIQKGMVSVPVVVPTVIPGNFPRGFYPNSNIQKGRVCLRGGTKINCRKFPNFPSHFQRK